MAESFFWTLKTELIYRRPWLTRESAREAIGEYIEAFYNRIRRHSTIGYVSPAEFEEMTRRKTGESTCPLFRSKVTHPTRIRLVDCERGPTICIDRMIAGRERCARSAGRFKRSSSMNRVLIVPSWAALLLNACHSPERASGGPVYVNGLTGGEEKHR